MDDMLCKRVRDKMEKYVEVSEICLFEMEINNK